MKKTGLFIICSFLITAAHSQSKDSSSFSLSLNQAVDYAMKNQFSVQNAELDKQIAEAKRKEILGLGLPQINGSFDHPAGQHLMQIAVQARAHCDLSERGQRDVVPRDVEVMERVAAFELQQAGFIFVSVVKFSVDQV